MTHPIKAQRLPMIFQPLDVEGSTRKVATVLCPERGDLMTVGTCGKCQDFHQVEFTSDGMTWVCCAPGESRQGREGVAPTNVKDVLQVPALCATAETPLGSVLAYVHAQPTHDAIPILDADARPIGIARCETLLELIRAGAPFEMPLEVAMITSVAHVTPETRIDEAAKLVTARAWKGAVGVAADGTFLGVVDPRYLAALET